MNSPWLLIPALIAALVTVIFAIRQLWKEVERLIDNTFID
jgi:hypothetical protein